MSYAILITNCIACDTKMTCNPAYVPSLRINGKREPICKQCHAKWNEIHRISKGLEPEPLHPEAYKACHESQLV